MTKNIFYWQAKEHAHQKRSNDWYWVLGIIAVAGAIVAVLFGNILFAVLILIASFAAALLVTKPPQTVQFGITERGIRVGTKLYPYQHLGSFWVTDEDGPGPIPPVLLIETESILNPMLVIPLVGVSAEKVRDFLVQKLEEEELHEPLSQVILEYLGF